MKRNSFIDQYRPGDPMKNYIILWLFLAFLSVYVLVGCKPAGNTADITPRSNISADTVNYAAAQPLHAMIVQH